MSTQGDTAATIREISEAHRGKVSDKWSSYLDEYERVFRDIKGEPVSLLEIGIQNGGSLEIWGKYFARAEKLVGCDINEKCRVLTFEDDRVSVVVGDANTDEVQRRIGQISPSFDIIIDDGSHKSGDIIRSFARYFPLLKPGGIFLAEDLHCSYWRDFDGGLFDPLSSISFFKDLADIISHDHWGIPESREALLEAYGRAYTAEFSETDLAGIHSVEFLDSICVVKKRAVGQEGLGRRCFSGSTADVFPVEFQEESSDPGKINGADDQRHNEWSGTELFHDKNAAGAVAGEIRGLRKKIGELENDLQSSGVQLAGAMADLKGANRQIEKLSHALALRENSLSWKLTAPLRGIGGIFSGK
ncbi:MAG: class I SAM-dependent methyltransferase [Terrimicrobiaceae bacterium]